VEPLVDHHEVAQLLERVPVVDGQPAADVDEVILSSVRATGHENARPGYRPTGRRWGRLDEERAELLD